MRIGLLAYHAACNFGAVMQLLSTFSYLKKAGHDPFILNWVAADLEEHYRKTTPPLQIEEMKAFRRSAWQETPLCRTTEDVARIITEYNIEAVIIGSDAVAQHHPLRERMVFPCRTIIGFSQTTSDRQFPNPFWATWNGIGSCEVPVALMSASSQDSAYKLIPASVRKDMDKQIMKYRYVSTRDSWTSEMFAYITHGKCVPEVTPDPVFAFNQNAAEVLPTKEDFLARHNLPEKYILLSFINSNTVSQEWISSFEKQANKEGYECALLPFAQKPSFGTVKHNIGLPLSPTDWYSLIRHSSGFVGHNMHPVVVSIHNGIPFFSFDNYGRKRFNGMLTDDRSSKIKHILDEALLSIQRISCIGRGFTPPPPEDVLQRIMSFPHANSKAFAANYLEKYNNMMNKLTDTLK